MIIILEDSDSLEKIEKLPPLTEADWMLKLNDPDEPTVVGPDDYGKLRYQHKQVCISMRTLAGWLKNYGRLITKF